MGCVLSHAILRYDCSCDGVPPCSCRISGSALDEIGVYLVIPLTIGLWWAVMAITPEPSEVTRLPAQIVSIWQTVNVQFLVSAALLASLLIICVYSPRKRAWLRIVGVLTFRILACSSRPVLALAVIVGAGLLFVGLTIDNGMSETA